MEGPSKKKRKVISSTIQEDDAQFPFPTLGQVAEQPRFEDLRELIGSVKNRPVNELGKNPKVALRKICDASLSVLLEMFFAACDARAEEVRSKRAAMVVTSEEELPG